MDRHCHGQAKYCSLTSRLDLGGNLFSIFNDSDLWLSVVSIDVVESLFHIMILMTKSAYRDREWASGVSQRVCTSDNGTNCEVFLQLEHL